MNIRFIDQADIVETNGQRSIGPVIAGDAHMGAGRVGGVPIQPIQHFHGLGVFDEAAFCQYVAQAGGGGDFLVFFNNDLYIAVFQCFHLGVIVEFGGPLSNHGIYTA